MENVWNNKFTSNNGKSVANGKDKVLLQTSTLSEGIAEDKSLMLKQLLGIVVGPSTALEVRIKF